MVPKFAYYPVAMDLLCRSDRAFWRLVYAGLYQCQRFHIEPEEHAVRAEKTEIEVSAKKRQGAMHCVQGTKPACGFSAFKAFPCEPAKRVHRE
jgi:hypothetical protein